MAFCNSCGASLADGTKFCNKCGGAVSGNASGMAPARPVQSAISAPPPSSGSSSAVKIILIIVGVIVLIGVLGIGTLMFVGYRVAKSAHVTQNGNNVKVETPFGSMETSKDPDKIAKDLGIDIYPGAEMQQNASAEATFAGVHTVTGSFESSDSVDKVCAFYKTRFPSATTTSSEQGRCTLVSQVPPNMVTIAIEARGDGAKFVISCVSKKSASNQ